MKTVEVQLPAELAVLVEAVVQQGTFSSVDEVVEHASREFFASARGVLAERHQLKDIDWALQQRGRD